MRKRAVQILLFLMVLSTTSGCLQEPNLVYEYVTKFKAIESLECTTVLVLPKYACRSCTRTTFDWINSSNNKVWIITDDPQFQGLPHTIMDNTKDQIVQYNPFINQAYFTIFIDGSLVDTKAIGVEDLKKLEEIYDSLAKQC